MIETERTLLRNFKYEDLNDFYEYSSQEGVGEMAGWAHHEDINRSKDVLKKFIENKNQFAIVLKENNKVIGHIGIHEDSEEGREDTKELGYVINKNYWGKGIMTEVVKSVLKYIFSNDYINYVYACCFTNNIGSKRVIEKCGFKFECDDVFYSKSLDKKFPSYDYVYTRDMWNSRSTNK